MSVVVLSSSLGTTSAMWAAQQAALADRFDVLAYDHRGHGDGPAPLGPYAVEELAGDVLALLDAHGLERVSFCGLSLAGIVGMWLAAHAPERIDRLVLCCTSAHIPPAERWIERAGHVRAAGTVEAIADAVLERWFTPGFAAREPGTIARMRAMLAAIPPEGYAGCCEAIAAADLRDDLAAIRAPTLVIAGADDPATPPDHGERLAAGIPGARLEVLASCAHLAAVEQPDAVSTLILDHLEAR